MPTINRYQGGGGYYIRARPSDTTGTITYKIRSFGTPVVREMEFHDGEEISWDSIDALKALGIVYTDESGTVGPDNFDPNADLLQKQSISGQKARRMLTAVQKHLDVNQQQLQSAADALGISHSQSGNDELSSASGDIQGNEAGQQPADGSDEGSYTPLTAVESYDQLEAGKKYAGTIDRISNAENAIIEFDTEHINIGSCYTLNAGTHVVFVFSGKTSSELVETIEQEDTHNQTTDSSDYLTRKQQWLLSDLRE